MARSRRSRFSRRVEGDKGVDAAGGSDRGRLRCAREDPQEHRREERRVAGEDEGTGRAPAWSSAATTPASGWRGSSGSVTTRHVERRERASPPWRRRRASMPAWASASSGYAISGLPAELDRRLRPAEPSRGATGQNGAQGRRRRCRVTARGSGTRRESRTEPAVGSRLVADLLPVADARAAVLAEVAGPLPAEPVPLERCAWAGAGGRCGLGRGRARVGQLGDGRLRGPRCRHRRRERRGAGRRCGSPASRAPARPPSATLGEGEAFGISTGARGAGGRRRRGARRGHDRAGGRADDRRRWRSASRSSRAATSAAPARTSAPVTRCSAPARSSARRSWASWPRSASPSPSARAARPWRSSRTGDELLAPSEPMRPGGVRNSNAYTLPALARLAGAEVVSVERCPDDPEATRDAAARATRGRRRRLLRRRLGGRPRSREGGVRRGGRRGALLGRRAPARQADVVRRSRGREPRVRASGQPGLGRSSPSSSSCGPALRALQGASPDLDAVEAMLADDVPRMERRDQAVRCGLTATARGLARDADRAAGLAHPHLDAGRRRARRGRGRRRAGARREPRSEPSSLARTLRCVVKVTVRLFAMLRERAGSDSVEIELRRGRDRRRRDRGARATTRRSATSRRGCRFGSPSTASTPTNDAPIAPGDELAAIPPVSGGAPETATGSGARGSAQSRSTRRPSRRSSRDPGAGAVVTFQGTTRDVSKSSPTTPTPRWPSRGSPEILARVRARATTCRAAAAEHRIGDVPLRRAERGRRRLGRAPRRGLRRSARGDRPDQGRGADLEERGEVRG